MDDFQKDWDESKHPRGESGPKTNAGSFSSAGGGGGDKEGAGGDGKEKPISGPSYGLVPKDVARFHELKSAWSKINNELLEHVDQPDGPESKALITKLEGIVKEIQGLHADP